MNFNNNPWIKAAKRVYSIGQYEAWDMDITPENIAAQMVHNPIDCINYLLDIIEDLQEVTE